MKYEDIASEANHMQACRDYVAAVYGEAVVHQMPAVVETLWCSLLAGATEELAQITILSDHRLPLP